jgi:hypothetical protein
MVSTINTATGILLHPHQLLHPTTYINQTHYTLKQGSPTIFIGGPHWLWQVEVDGQI